jgi:hypothetical protein
MGDHRSPLINPAAPYALTNLLRTAERLGFAFIRQTMVNAGWRIDLSTRV